MHYHFSAMEKQNSMDNDWKVIEDRLDKNILSMYMLSFFEIPKEIQVFWQNNQDKKREGWNKCLLSKWLLNLLVFSEDIWLGKHATDMFGVYEIIFQNDVIFNNAIVMSPMQPTAEEGPIAAKGCFTAARDNYDGHLYLEWMASITAFSILLH
ncbi:hypothetical protein ACJX0J_038105, partial [Zea mays]